MRRRWIDVVGIALVLAGLGYGAWTISGRPVTPARTPAPFVAAPVSGPDVLEPVPAVSTSAAPAPAASAPPARPAQQRVIFGLEVPKVGYSGGVQEGVTASVLAAGPGHYPGTALPGANGIVGVAGHNDDWTAFGGIAPGDEVLLETSTRTYVYRVTRVAVVEAGDRSILVPTAERRLALTTCWPLWAGALATQRLAIVATLAG